MALNFGLLDTSLPEKIAGSYYAGQQERQKNELAAQQTAMRQQELGMRQQEFGMRQQEAAQLAQERQAKLQRSAENQKLLDNLYVEMEKHGHKPDRPTLGQMLKVGLQTNQSELVQIATKGLQALDEKEQFEGEMARFAPTPAAPAAANALAPTAQPATTPAPTNALAGGYSRPQIESMLTSPNARMREMGGKLLGALPKEMPDTLSQRYMQVGRNVFDRLEQKWITPPEMLETTKPSIAAAPTSRGAKAPSGYRFTESGELEPIPGGPAAKGKEPTVSEQNASYNISRVLNAATEIQDVIKKDPSALAPGPAEAAARSVGMEGAANVARSTNRQIVYGAQRDSLDALLYLATGAAYNKEQLQGAWDSYMPAFTDDAKTREAKRLRLNTLLKTAKLRAGKAWTPEMDQAMENLTFSNKPATVPGRTNAPAVSNQPGSKLTAAEQAELEQLRQRFGKK
jgi:hypothetical protein